MIAAAARPRVPRNRRCRILASTSPYQRHVRDCRRGARHSSGSTPRHGCDLLGSPPIARHTARALRSIPQRAVERHCAPLLSITRAAPAPAPPRWPPPASSAPAAPRSRQPRIGRPLLVPRSLALKVTLPIPRSDPARDATVRLPRSDRGSLNGAIISIPARLHAGLFGSGAAADLPRPRIARAPALPHARRVEGTARS